jgi:hypothetical protein
MSLVQITTFIWSNKMNKVLSISTTIILFAFFSSFAYPITGTITNNTGYTMDIIGYFDGETNVYRGEHFVENGQTFDLSTLGTPSGDNYRLCVLLRQKKDPKSQTTRQWVRAEFMGGSWNFKICNGEYSKYEGNNFDYEVDFPGQLPSVICTRDGDVIKWGKSE